MNEASGGWTPLMEAAVAGRDDVVRLLLQHGARANVKAPLLQHATPLLTLAARNGQTGVVRMLLEEGSAAESSLP